MEITFASCKNVHAVRILASLQASENGRNGMKTEHNSKYTQTKHRIVLFSKQAVVKRFVSYVEYLCPLCSLVSLHPLLWWSKRFIVLLGTTFSRKIRPIIKPNMNGYIFYENLRVNYQFLRITQFFTIFNIKSLLIMKYSFHIRNWYWFCFWISVRAGKQNKSNLMWIKMMMMKNCVTAEAVSWCLSDLGSK